MFKSFLAITILSFSFLSAQPSKYQLALAELASKDTVKAINYLKISGEEEKNPLAFYELSKIYYNKGSFTKYSEALSFINEALDFDSKNVEFRFLKALILEERCYESIFYRNARNMAITIHEEIVDENPNYEPCWRELGRLYKEDFEKYQFSQKTDVSRQHSEPKQITKISNMVRIRSTLKQETYNEFFESIPKPSLKYDKIIQKMFDQSENALLNGLKISKSENSLLYLTELYIKNHLYDKALDVISQNKLLFDKTEKFFLYEGLLNYLMGNIDLSVTSYQKAFEFMDKSTKNIYTEESIKKIISVDTLKALDEKNNEFAKKYLKNYLLKKDPLFLTNYNERVLEHYSRVVYSNLMFSVPRLNIEGWNSERGEIIIKFGIPQKIIKLRENAHFTREKLLQYYETEIIQYADKSFSFVDPYRRGGYVFNNPDKLGGTKSSGYEFQSYQNTEDSVMIRYRKSKPEEYIPKFAGPQLNIPYSVYQLKSFEDNKTDIYVATLINPKDSTLEKKYFEEGYQHALYLLDKENNRLNEKIKKQSPLKSDRNFAINSISINTSSKTGTLVFELLRKKDNGVFTARNPIQIKEFSNKGLSVSDIILGFDVNTDPAVGGAIQRKNIFVQPNPTKSFWRGVPIFLYYEIENLGLQENLTNFEQRINVQRKEEGILSSLLDVVGISSSGEKLTLTSSYKTQEQNPQMYLQLDMEKYESGNYLITIEIKDKIRGKEVSSSVEINLSN